MNTYSAVSIAVLVYSMAIFFLMRFILRHLESKESLLEEGAHPIFSMRARAVIWRASAISHCVVIGGLGTGLFLDSSLLNAGHEESMSILFIVPIGLLVFLGTLYLSSRYRVFFKYLS